MTIKDRLKEDMKAAMKSGDKLTLSAIRMANAAIKQYEIDKRVELDDAGTIGILTTLIKQRRDSAEQYRNGERADLAEKEEAEIVVLQRYLPAQMSEAEVEAAVKEAIAETGASSAKEMGKVMAVLMPKTKGRADGKLVNEWVKKLLGG